MKTFRLVIREIWHAGYTIKAKNIDDAKKKFLEGEADPIDNDLECSHIDDNPIVSVEEE